MVASKSVSKTKARPLSKRAMSAEEKDESSDRMADIHDDLDDVESESMSNHDAGQAEGGDEEEEQGDDRFDTEDLSVNRAKKVKGPLSLKNVANFKKKQDRTGVVYISRVPPYMKPEKLKHLLGRHAEIGRVFLTPEDPAVRSKRKSMGGNKKQSYVDGWVEFQDKKDAKKVASALNCQPIGGRSTSFFSADMWNLRYLSKFKWHHLTEKIAYDNNVRRHKLQAEISQAKREKDFYLERVDQNKKISKKAKKAEGAGDSEHSDQVHGRGEILRTFRQAEAIKYLEKAAREIVYFLIRTQFSILT